MTDPLSDLLSISGVEGSLISRAQVGHPWGLASSALPRAIFHAPLVGTTYLQIDDAPPHRITTGDVAVLPRGDAHRVMDRPDRSCRPLADHPVHHDPLSLPTVVDHRPRVDLDLLCGSFVVGPPARTWLLDPLPDLFVVRGSSITTRYIDATLALMESTLADGGLGARLISDRLVEVLVVHLLRAWADAEADRAAGWLKGMADPQVSRVLCAVHADPTHPWSVATMARIAGLSRTRFMARFRHIVGLPPGTWITEWRIAVACSALRSGADVANAAQAAGYASEASFSRAFKRVIGQSPAAWRSITA